MRWPIFALTFVSLFLFSIIEASGMWLDVPFVKQKGNGCGAACISMVMRYWALSTPDLSKETKDPDLILQALYSPKANGIYSSAMESYFKQHGFRTFTITGDLNELSRQLRSGRPLIVCLSENGKTDSLHYVVVVGMDWNANVVMLNDPAQKKMLKMDRAAFEKSWGAMKSWTLLAVPEHGQ
jgi:ABC-type bacteriocin/lantibiotic exporter with double-glycine peptidase domain